MNDEIETIPEEQKRGPGRPKRDPVGQSTPLNAAKSGSKPRKRVGDADRQILPDTSRMDQNYKYRVVNEGKNGVGLQDVLDRGYEIVHSDGSLVTEEAGKASGITSQVQIIANASDGEKGVLVRIHKDLFNEDQADKQRVVEKAEAMLTRTPDGATGGVTRNR